MVLVTFRVKLMEFVTGLKHHFKKCTICILEVNFTKKYKINEKNTFEITGPFKNWPQNLEAHTKFLYLSLSRNKNEVLYGDKIISIKIKTHWSLWQVSNLGQILVRHSPFFCTNLSYATKTKFTRELQTCSSISEWQSNDYFTLTLSTILYSQNGDFTQCE